jgi:hypothetical protein
MRTSAACVLFVAGLLLQPVRAADFSNWAAIVVAGDWRASTGAASKVFDNGRRRIAQELIGIGFSPANVLQFTARMKNDPADAAEPATAEAIARGLSSLTARARGGCLVYMTSHGSPDGIALGGDVLAPARLAGILDEACGARPTVVIVSACFSGVYVPALKKRNRFVLTASAADRTSFGCGVSDRYTYFDACAVSLLPQAGSFENFGNEVRDCVHEREAKERMRFSDPQLEIGTAAKDAIPRWK